MSFVGNVQLVAGNISALTALRPLLKGEGIETEGSPDVYVREYNSFGVDEAREVSAKAASRALSAPRRVFIIVASSVTNEAQNALLKTLEEPSGDALFILVVPSPQQLLPTLRSRAQVLDVGATSSSSLVDTEAFLKAKPEKRLEMLKPLFDKGDDDKRDVGASISFLSALEGKLAAQPERNEAGLEAVYRARKYIGDKGSLAKALLEQVALLV